MASQNEDRERERTTLVPRRVVVTGLGAITTIGHGAAGLWDGILCERSAVKTITRFDASDFPCRIAAEIRDFNPADYMEGKSLRRLDRCSQFAVAASRLALEDSGLKLPEDTANIGVCIGSALGGAAYAEGEHTKFHHEGLKAISPMLALQMFVGASSCSVAIEFGLRGFTTSNADSCASGAIAIGNAYAAIQRGDADIMLAGGSEAPLAPLCFGAFALIHAMSTRNEYPASACRPFDANRDGFVMAEGAAVLVLEEREAAVKRGATIYAEIAGFACGNDAFHMASPPPDASGAANCIRRALKSAHVLPEQIDYINAHGSSTRLNDSSETKAIKSALGETEACRIPVSATKSLHAHALGATGAIEAAVCCLAMQHNHIPPTLNQEYPDPECNLNIVANQGVPAPLNTVLSNSFGFGGINAALIFQKPATDVSGVETPF